MEPFRFRGTDYLLKRDDLIHPCLSGNKYRKLYTLLQTPSEAISQISSYGGVQSNAMAAIACMCAQKGWAFRYYVKRFPHALELNPAGNLKQALELGMELRELGEEAYNAKVSELLHAPCDMDKVVIPQGGASHAAEAGIRQLCEELEAYALADSEVPLAVATPSGTGTTAYYLAKHLPRFNVYTTPLVGDERYLREQMARLGPIPENLKVLHSAKHYRFANLYREHLAVYRELLDAGVTFDLLYAPKMWLTLFENRERVAEKVLYIHSGGMGGNGSMLERYRRKEWL